MQTHSLGNIIRVVPVDMINKTPAGNFDTDGNFVDEAGFFIRVEGAGYLTYCPLNNKLDAEAIYKWFDTLYIFTDPEICRKIIHTPTSPVSEATLIFVGYGV